MESEEKEVEKNEKLNGNDRIHGLRLNDIENKDKYQSLIDDEVRCPMCLEVVLNPLECKICNTLICENCYLILRIANKTCPTEKCEGKYAKANKYVREFLRALIVTCSYCQKKGMNYEHYTDHLKECVVYKQNPIFQIIQKIREKDKELDKIKASLSQSNQSTNISNSSVQKKNENLRFSQPLPQPQPQFQPQQFQPQPQPIPQRRPEQRFDPSQLARLVTNRLSGQQKMELYKCCTEGKKSNFANLVERKGYPILEEISAKNFGWTSLHYGMHYGKIEIIEYILNYLKDRGNLEMAMYLRSSDGRTPLLCLLRSSNIDVKTKKQIFTAICNKFKLAITEEVRYELGGRKMDDVLRNLTYNY